MFDGSRKNKSLFDELLINRGMNNSEETDSTTEPYNSFYNRTYNRTYI